SAREWLSLQLTAQLEMQRLPSADAEGGRETAGVYRPCGRGGRANASSGGGLGRGGGLWGSTRAGKGWEKGAGAGGPTGNVKSSDGRRIAPLLREEWSRAKASRVGYQIVATTISNGKSSTTWRPLSVTMNV